MIRLATVFSGIGAIEHALQRMGIEHKLVFACDNGDLEILTKKVDMNLDDIGDELTQLETIIKAIQFNDEVEDLYKMQLANMLNEAVAELEELKSRLRSLPEHKDELVKQTLLRILEMSTLKTARAKEYSKFYEELDQGSMVQKRLHEFQIILEISNDYKKDNALDDLGKDIEFTSTDS